MMSCCRTPLRARRRLSLPTPTPRSWLAAARSCWDRYRQHEDSSCQSVARAGQLDAAFGRYLDWLEAYLAREGVTDPELRAAMRNALRRHRHPLLVRLESKASRALRHALRR